MKTCPACTGPLVPLGQLGMRQHYRCRNCGLDCSHLKKVRTPKSPKAPKKPEVQS